MSEDARKEYDLSIRRMFKEQVVKQQVEFQDIAQNSAEQCPAKHDGYHCTLKTGHACDHVAHGNLGYIHHRWNDQGAVSKDGVAEI